MTPLYFLLGKPGNLEEAKEKAKSLGLPVDIIPRVRIYINPNGSFLDASYFIKLQLGGGGYPDSLKLNSKYLGELGTSELEIIIKILEKAIGIEDKMAEDEVYSAIKENKSQELRKKLSEYDSLRKKMKNGGYLSPLVLQTRDAGREFADLAKAKYVDFDRRIGHNAFRDLAIDFCNYLRHLGHYK